MAPGTPGDFLAIIFGPFCSLDGQFMISIKCSNEFLNKISMHKYSNKICKARVLLKTRKGIYIESATHRKKTRNNYEIFPKFL